MTQQSRQLDRAGLTLLLRNDLGSLAAVVAEYRHDNEHAVAGPSDARSNESADEILVDCGLVTVHPGT